MRTFLRRYSFSLDLHLCLFSDKYVNRIILCERIFVDAKSDSQEFIFNFIRTPLSVIDERNDTLTLQNIGF